MKRLIPAVLVGLFFSLSTLAQNLNPENEAFWKYFGPTLGGGWSDQPAAVNDLSNVTQPYGRLNLLPSVTPTGNCLVSNGSDWISGPCGGGGGGGMDTSASNAVLPAARVNLDAMARDASDATLPTATRNMGLSFTVKPGQSIQTALTAAASAGGTVFIQAGAYAITSPLRQSSGTSIVCEKGVTITASSVGWSDPDPDPVNGTHRAHILNTNHGYYNNVSDSIVDQNLSVEGCNFKFAGTFASNGTAHAIQYRKAKNIRVVGNTFMGGGNATALIGVDNTLVAENHHSVVTTGNTHSNTTLDNIPNLSGVSIGDVVDAPGVPAGTTVVSVGATSVTLSAAATATASGVQVIFGPAQNVCFDHWEAASDIVTRDNTCGTVLYGLMATGTDTNNTTALVSKRGTFSGNKIAMGSTAASMAGIWLNGLGPAGSGSTNMVVTGNQVYGNGTGNFVCLKASGGGTSDSIFTGNTCRDSGTASIGATGGVDPAGTASNITFAYNIYDNIRVQAGDIGVVQLAGPNIRTFGERITGGSYPSLVYATSTDNSVINIDGQTGSGARFNTTSATRPTVIDTDPADGTSRFYQPVAQRGSSATLNVEDTRAVAVGIGGAISLKGLNTNGAQVAYAGIGASAIGATPGAEAGALKLMYVSAGTLFEGARISNLGGGMLALGGGQSSSFPAFKRSTTTIQVRLADDSAYTNLDALAVLDSGTAPTGTAGSGYVRKTSPTITSPTFASGATLSSGTLTGVPAPSAASDAVPKSYADAISAGVVTHSSVVAKSTVNLTTTYANGAAGVGATLTNSGALSALTIDGVAINNGDRVLIANQTTTFENGIYTQTTAGTGAVAWVLTRATDFDAAAANEVAAGAAVIVLGGTQAATQWVETGQGPFTIGTTPIIFSQVLGGSSSGTVSSGSANQLGYYAGAGTTISGLATANNGVLITSGGGVPSISSTIPNATQDNITRLGTVSSGIFRGTAVEVTYGGTGANLSATGGTSQVLKQSTLGGTVTVGTLSCADLSDNAASCSTDTTNASNISSGTLSQTRGGAGTIIGALKANGAGAVSQASCADLTNGTTSCSVDTTNAANITSGILPIARHGTFAHTQRTVAADAGTTNTTGLMMGLAGTITPTVSGTVRISVCGDNKSATIGNGVNTQLRTGTGAAPAVGAALTGTTRGSLSKFVASTVAGKARTCLIYTVTGLALNTAVWIDVGRASVGGGLATFTDVDIIADEIL